MYSIKNKNNNNENNNENNDENNENNNNDNIIVINNENNNSNKNLNNKNICNIILKESKDSYECFSDEEDEEDDESNKLGNNKSFRLTYINKNINNNNNNNINNNINNSNNKNNNIIINNNNNKNKEIIDNLNKLNSNSNSTFYSSKDTNQFKNNLSSLPTYRERKSDNDVIKNTPFIFNTNNKINKNNTYKTLEIHKNNFIDELKIFQQGKNPKKNEIPSHKSNNSISITNTLSNKISLNNLSESISSQNENIDVLIVDDEQFNLNALSKNLKKLGISCDKSMNGAECINLIKEKKKKNIYYKLILMDIIMPVLGGIDA